MNSHVLDPAIEAKARELCARITVAHDLDPEIQEELYGHIEDKIIGYLKGEVPVSGEDALLLVREHFGSPEVIKALLQEAHANEAMLSQGRRLAAAAIVTLGCLFVAKIALSLLSLGFRFYQLAYAVPEASVEAGAPSHAAAPSLPSGSLLYALTFLAIIAGMTMSPWGIFVHWRRRLREGCRPWYYRWSAIRLSAATLGLVLLNSLTPFFAPGGFAIESNVVLALNICLVYALYVCQCLSWIWWCDAPPRTKRNTLNAAYAWVLCLALVSMLPPVAINIAASPGSAEQIVGYTLLAGHFLDTKQYWTLSWNVSTQTALVQGPVAFLSMGLAGAIAAFSYGFAKLIRKQRETEFPGERLGMT